MIEETAFVREAQEMLGGMYRLSVSILRRREDAQDAVQQAMLRAWERRAQARETTFRGWLTRIVINEC
ncbi:MAG: RNA polymerase subunit sigma-70, partial [Clostridiales bacterium]|nr:RNA polymerase subunit sigma-70 [Clostridiales bacterium]